MRLTGIILVLVGLYLAIARPWFNANFSGEEIANITVYDKSSANLQNRGWHVNQVFLDPKDNPIRVRIAVHRLPGQIYNDGILNLLVRVVNADKSGSSNLPILDEKVTIHLNAEPSSATTTQGAKTFVVSTSDFYADFRGYHKIGALPVVTKSESIDSADLNIDRNVIQINASVIKSPAPLGSSATILGFMMVFGGFVLISFARHKNPRKPKAAPPVEEFDEPDDDQHPLETNPIPEKSAAPPVVAPKPRSTDVGKTIKWGRNAGKKR